MVDLEYVFSGTGMMRFTLFKSKEYVSDEYNENKVRMITKGVAQIKQTCKDVFPEFNVKTSLLYNAYVESSFGNFYKTYNNFGFDHLYADSGGLQVITTGKQLTEDLKLQIYENQKNADYGFCFDEIPVENKGIALSGGGRANVSSKHFNNSRFVDCAIKTGNNINHQLKAFNGTNTSVFYIVQGNTYQDMYTWFKEGYNQLEYKNNIAGIAPADTCMGNGELESCDMLMASKLIFQEFEELEKRIHLLGIGSPTRMLPVLLLSKSGFLDNVNISFDSSSNAMAYVMGKFKDADGNSANNKIQINKSISDFLDYFDELFKSEVPTYKKDVLYNYIVDNDILRTCGKITDQGSIDLPEYNTITSAFIPLYTTWLNIGFFKRCRYMLEDKKIMSSAIGMLQHVKTTEDYLYWRRQYSSNIKSARMDRKPKLDITSLFS